MPHSPDGTAYDYRQKHNAPTVIFIHGLGLNRETWSEHLDDYANHYSVLTYDLCGHGETILPSHNVNLTLLSEQLYALMQHLKIQKAALIGFSLGGMINRRFALDHPEHLSALVILNSPHERGENAQKLVEQRALDSAAGGPEATIDATLDRWFTPTFRNRRADMVNWVRKTVLANDKDNYAAHRFTLAAGVKELINPNPSIQIPSLIITCENDTGSTPDMSHKIGSEIDGSEVVIVPELQHLGLLEAPHLFTSPIIHFLQRAITAETGEI